jgi:hypothetical protein
MNQKASALYMMRMVYCLLFGLVACSQELPKEPQVTQPKSLPSFPSSLPAHITQTMILSKATLQDSLSVFYDCKATLRLLESHKKLLKKKPEYYFMTGRCLQVSKPEVACTAYLRFLELSSKGPRAEEATAYIREQDPAVYPTCLLPEQSSLESEVMVNEILKTLASVGGCPRGQLLLEEYQSRFGADNNYYFYSAFCYIPTSPNEACNLYRRMVPPDTRFSWARHYMKEQDPKKYPNCATKI